MDCSLPGSSVLLVSTQGKWTVTSVLKLDSVYGLVKTVCDSTGGILSNMVTQGASQHLEQHLALDGQ